MTLIRFLSCCTVYLFFSCFLMFLASRRESLWAAPQSEAVRWMTEGQQPADTTEE